jgi:hypothetical protein
MFFSPGNSLPLTLAPGTAWVPHASLGVLASRDAGFEPSKIQIKALKEETRTNFHDNNKIVEIVEIVLECSWTVSCTCMLDYARAVPGAVSCITFMSCPSLSAVWAACRSAKNCVSREAIAIAYISTAADRQVPKGAQKAAIITCAFCSILCHSSRKVKQNMSFDKCYFKCYIILYNML